MSEKEEVRQIGILRKQKQTQSKKESADASADASATASTSASASASKRARNRKKGRKTRREVMPLMTMLDKVRTFYADRKQPIDRKEICEIFVMSGFNIRIATLDETYRHPELFVINDESIPTSGIVVDSADNFRVLARPLPDTVRDEYAIKFCLSDIDNYDVYRAVDGTRVTLYYVARFDEWLMATVRASDVLNLCWMGHKTYGEIFAECCPPGFSFDVLDKARQYSFIFHHHSFHALGGTCELWQIEGPAVDGVSQYSSLIVRKNAGESAEEFATRLVTDAGDSLTAFINEEKKKGEQADECALARERDFSRLCYGFIFRRREGFIEGGPPPAAYLESELYKFIRKQLYDIPQSVDWITHDNREIYVHVRAYMAETKKNLHLMVFPRAVIIYGKMDFIIKSLADMTVANMRRARPADESASTGACASAVKLNSEQERVGEVMFAAAWTQVYERLVKIASSVAAHLMVAKKIGAFGNHIHANVRDQYLNVANMQEFVNLIAMRSH